MAIDWETDERSFSEVLKSWHKRHDWTRARAAEELRVSEGMYNQWCSKKPCSREKTLRRLMTMIDAEAENRAEIADRIRRAVDAVLYDPNHR